MTPRGEKGALLLFQGSIRGFLLGALVPALGLKEGPDGRTQGGRLEARRDVIQRLVVQVHSWLT